MKTFRATKGPFTERPYYTTDEIEQICNEELEAVGLLPTDPMPIRIERFIEKRFNVTPQYEELPEGVLGFTKFGPDGVEAVVVSRTLTEESTSAAARRLSATFAHEAGHGLLHAHLFVLSVKPQSLFGEDGDLENQRVLCRNVAAMGDQQGRLGYDGRWWEFQANQVMGALLLPRRLVVQGLDGILIPAGSLGTRSLPKERREQAVRLVADLFEVNPVVARIRLGELYPEKHEDQLTL